MSLLDRRAPKPGLLPVPPFAVAAALHTSRWWLDPAGPGPLLFGLGFYNKSQRMISIQVWAVELTGALTSNFLVVGRDETTVPSGAEYWACAMPTNPALVPLYEYLRVRWRLAL